jgi:hypothetical protein
VVPYILVIGYDNKEEPLHWAPVTMLDVAQDRKEIEKLTPQARDPKFYGTIEGPASAWLVSVVPHCSN